MNKTFIIGLDIGTSSIKGILVSANGDEKYTGRVPFEYTTRDDGSVEISAYDYLASCYKLLRNLSAKLPNGARIAAISAASASGNLLLLDEDGKPAGPIFNWQDHRVTDEARRVLGEFDIDSYYRSTGWQFSFKSLPLAILCYYKCHHPEILESCSKVCMSTEYLYFKLTGKWGIGTSAGTPFYLIDQVSRKYRTDILDTLGISPNKLPPIMRTGSVLGEITEAAAKECGIKAGTPVIIGTFDHPSAARGVGVTKEGQLLLSCGTSWVGFYPINDREKIASAGMLIDPFLSESGGPWAGMISLASLSGQIESYTKAFVDSSNVWYKKLVEYSERSESGAGGLSINLLESPNDAEIRKYEKRHIARAIMENVINMLSDSISRISKAGISCNEAVMVGGPSENPLWARLIEEKTGIKVRVLHGSYAGAIGAAALAGTAVGLYPNEESAQKSLTTK